MFAGTPLGCTALPGHPDESSDHGEILARSCCKGEGEDSAYSLSVGHWDILSMDERCVQQLAVQLDETQESRGITI